MFYSTKKYLKHVQKKLNTLKMKKVNATFKKTNAHKSETKPNWFFQKTKVTMNVLSFE
jgi:hypothetical protein